MFWSSHPLADKTNNEHLRKPFFKVENRSIVLLLNLLLFLPFSLLSPASLLELPNILNIPHTLFVFFFSFPPSVWLYISAVLGGCFINGSIPLFYELTIETTYPIAEGIPMAVVTTSNHVACLLFLAALMIPGIGKSDGKLAPTSSLCLARETFAKKQYWNCEIHNHTVSVISINVVPGISGHKEKFREALNKTVVSTNGDHPIVHVYSLLS